MNPAERFHNDPRSINDILRDHGYGHRPARGVFGENGLHEIFSFNTMEVVAVAGAGNALKAVGLEG